MAPEGYGQLDKALKRLEGLVPEKKVYSPALTRRKTECLVGQDLKVHVLRCASDPNDDSAAMRPIEYAVLDPNKDDELQWQRVSGEVFNPAFPWLAARDGDLVAGFVGTLQQSEAALKLKSYQALVCYPGGNGSEAPTVAMDRVSGTVRAAVGGDGSVYLVARAWFPPPDMPEYTPLRLAALKGGTAQMVADPIPDTDTPRSFPRDWAVHVGGDGRIHLVYDGMRKDMEDNKPHLWHLVLDTEGKVQAVHDLAPAPTHPILTRIFAGPKGQLVYLLVFSSPGNPQESVHVLIPLEERDPAPGPKEHYFVDYWLQAHAVWYEGNVLNYQGPKGMPQ